MSDTDPILAAAERFAAVHVVVVGSMNVDQITYCRRVPDEGETLVADRYEQGFGGKGANQAVMAARLGARVSFVGCVGDDALGAETVANLTANGVDTAGIRVVAETATGVAPIWVDEHGANRILIAPGANNALDAAHVRSALDALDHPPDVVVAQLETPQAATAAAFAWAAEHEIVTVLNPAPAATILPDVLEHTTWLVPNEPEFELLFGSPVTADNVAAAAGRARPRRHLWGRRRARRRRVGGSPVSRPRSSTSSTPPAPATPSSVRSAWPSPPPWPRSTPRGSPSPPPPAR